SLEPGSLGQIEHEMESRPLLELRLDTELATHRGNQLLADRQAKPRARERVVSRDLPLAKRLEQVRHHVLGNAAAGVLHRELDASAVDLLARNVDRASV